MNNLEIKEIREKLQLTQEQFAEKIGVTPRTIQNWENGSKIPPPAKRKKIDELAQGGCYNVATNINGNNNQNSGLVIEALTKQLDVKDKQIDQLLQIIDRFAPNK